MTDQDKIMRKSFEAWAEETWPTTITPDGDGYKEPEIQIDWECWQAATAAAMSMKPESIDTSTERVDVGEPVGWMFQHEETGNMDVVDVQQVEWGFEKNNPRWQKLFAIYSADQLAAAVQQERERCERVCADAIRSGKEAP